MSQSSTDLVPAPAWALPPAPGEGALEAIKQRAHEQLVRQLDLTEVKRLPPERRHEALRPVVARVVTSDEPALSPEARERIVDDILDELLGLGPLEKLLRDPSISDILINGPHDVWVERGGRLEEVRLHFRDDQHLLDIIDRIVSRIGRRIDDTSPMVDARLPDGSRVNAVIAPLSLKGPALSIRRFGARPLTLDDLLNFKALTTEMAMVLEAAVRARLNIIVSGGTGSGKTTLLNTLSRFIPDDERILTIEDAAELRLQQRHVLPLETRPPNVEGKGGVSMRDLVRNALRMRPDRIVVGECRGAEALDMLQAMNSGHEGSLTTLHANSPRDALTRLETMLLMAGFEVPIRALRRQITSAIHLIVQAERLQGGARKVTSLTEVVGMEGDVIVTQELFAYEQQSIDYQGRARGQFVSTGVRPRFAAQLESSGLDLPSALFAERVLMRA
jgi:pilus assembly protein CpaF